MNPRIGRLLVVAAHPDDETLAAGGFLRAAHAAGSRIELVVATDGEAAFPQASPADRRELARTRRDELHRALTALGVGDIAVHWLGLPDSGLAAVEDRLAQALRLLASGVDACLGPWVHDPHPDHAAAGRAMLAAAPAGAHRFGYPIWTWPWGDPADPRLPWAHVHVHELDADARRAKQRAIGCHASQLRAAPDGGDPILPAPVLAHFDTGRETFFRIPPTASAPAERFASLYRDGGGDPWQTRTSWYERRKRAVLTACLPAPRYQHAAEPGCGTGELTRELAQRCAAITASDYAAAAVAATRAAVSGRSGITVEQLALPDPRAVPDGVDLVVCSEVLYYLGADDLDAVVDRIAGAARPGADVVLVHWSGPAAESPQDAWATHRRFLDDPRFATVVEHVDAEFLLHVVRCG
jgi:LmbE family N-acetylglucosaminyl deacetylase/SAM-dependent methyltransferase